MDEDLRETLRLEEELLQVMTALIVRDPNAWARIQRCIHALEEPGADLSEQQVLH